MKLRTVGRLVSHSFNDWIEDECFRLSAAIAFYTMFSLAPALVIIVAIVDSIYSGNTTAEIQDYLATYVGPRAASAITEAAAFTADGAQSGLIATIVSAAMILIGASAAFAELQRAMNRVWEIEPVSTGIRRMLRNRLLGFLMVLFITLLSLISILITAGLSAYRVYLETYIPGAQFAWRYVDVAVSFGAFIVLFAALFKFLPDATIHWKDVWIGGFITACLFILGKAGIAYYIKVSSVSAAYGAAGAIMVVLAWIYYATLIFFLGAEFTQAYADTQGKKVVPKEYAVHRPHRKGHHAPVYDSTH